MIVVRRLVAVINRISARGLKVCLKNRYFGDFLFAFKISRMFTLKVNFFQGWYGCICSPVVLWNVGERLGDSNACLTAWLPGTGGLIRTKIRTVGGIKVCNINTKARKISKVFYSSMILLVNIDVDCI